MIVIEMLITFTGHFIILCKYIEKENLFEYRDPAKDSSKSHFALLLFMLTVSLESCIVAEEDLEKARKSTGTDEDIIFITPSNER